ncbi:DUF805 domain-containing protein [Aliiruegeria sabulilitoris]|uniref:DUF805 domain-containing protein n=1 Tax=Aliiruegeria sabulilitoris TaxID=1510458 RepID=UPI0008298A35|nr:DUF805 domain-containing protein [Aliiruegeria sabulilitoris]NDR58942.1 DUF805 domain-containing protein [Pseudoruegeria sp. M32A2M]
MGIIEATRSCFSRYATFSGRSSRPEFWWFMLFYGICMVIASVIDISAFGETVTTVDASGENGTAAGVAVTRRHHPVQSLVWLVFFLPVLAASWRRMQDTGRPGATILIPLIISLAAGVFLFLGVLGFSLLEMVGIDGQFLRTLAASLGIAGLAVSVALYVTMRLLILWWLTRPSQKGPNQYGRQPAH